MLSAKRFWPSSLRHFFCADRCLPLIHAAQIACRTTDGQFRVSRRFSGTTSIRQGDNNDIDILQTISGNTQFKPRNEVGISLGDVKQSGKQTNNGGADNSVTSTQGHDAFCANALGNGAGNFVSAATLGVSGAQDGINQSQAKDLCMIRAFVGTWVFVESAHSNRCGLIDIFSFESARRIGDRNVLHKVDALPDFSRNWG